MRLTLLVKSGLFGVFFLYCLSGDWGFERFVRKDGHARRGRDTDRA